VSVPATRLSSIVRHMTRSRGGFWLLPGLINCHDHLMDKGLGRRQGSEGAWRHDFSGRPPGFQALECAKNAHLRSRRHRTTDVSGQVSLCSGMCPDDDHALLHTCTEIATDEIVVRGAALDDSLGLRWFVLVVC